MFKSYLEKNFEVIIKADNSRYANNFVIRLVNLGPIALFKTFKLTTSSGKHLEDISHTHLVSLMYKLTISAKDSNDLSIGFDWDRGRRKDELSNNKNLKGKNHLRIMFKDVFGFAEHQEKATNGLGYKMTLTRDKDETVIDKAADIADARKKNWSYSLVRTSLHTIHFTQQSILSKKILTKTPTELRYIERSVFVKEVENPNQLNLN